MMKLNKNSISNNSAQQPDEGLLANGTDLYALGSGRFYAVDIQAMVNAPAPEDMTGNAILIIDTVLEKTTPIKSLKLQDSNGKIATAIISNGVVTQEWVFIGTDSGGDDPVIGKLKASAFIALSFTDFTISDDSNNPSFIQGLQFFGSDNGDFILDPVDGSIENNTGRTIDKMVGGFSFQPDKTGGGGTESLYIYSERSVDGGVTWTPSQGTLREFEIPNNGESFRTSISGLTSFLPGEKVRFRAFSNDNDLDFTVRDTVAEGVTITGGSFAWELQESISGEIEITGGGGDGLPRSTVIYSAADLLADGWLDMTQMNTVNSTDSPILFEDFKPDSGFWAFEDDCLVSDKVFEISFEVFAYHNNADVVISNDFTFGTSATYSISNGLDILSFSGIASDGMYFTQLSAGGDLLLVKLSYDRSITNDPQAIVNSISETIYNLSQQNMVVNASTPDTYRNVVVTDNYLVIYNPSLSSSFSYCPLTNVSAIGVIEFPRTPSPSTFLYVLPTKNDTVFFDNYYLDMRTGGTPFHNIGGDSFDLYNAHRLVFNQDDVDYISTCNSGVNSRCAAYDNSRTWKDLDVLKADGDSSIMAYLNDNYIIQTASRTSNSVPVFELVENGSKSTLDAANSVNGSTYLQPQTTENSSWSFMQYTMKRFSKGFIVRNPNGGSCKWFKFNQVNLSEIELPVLGTMGGGVLKPWVKNQ